MPPPVRGNKAPPSRQRNSGRGGGGNASTVTTTPNGGAVPAPTVYHTVTSSDDDDVPIPRHRAAVRSENGDDGGQLGRDIAEAQQLGIDPEFVEQLRIMTPRSRATILSDLRPPPPRPAASAGVPPPRRGQPAAASQRGGRGRGPNSQPRGRQHRVETYEFDDDDEDALADEEDEYEDYDDDDGENEFVRRPPPGAFQSPGLFPALETGGGGAEGLAQVFALLGALQRESGGRGRGGSQQGRPALPRGLLEALERAQQASHQARAMGADLDVDNMSYEELLALQERVGHVSRGFGEGEIERVTSICPPQSKVGNGSSKDKDADSESCVICMADFADTLDNDCRRIHRCGHVFHAVCLARWFKDSKTCPICAQEAS